MNSLTKITTIVLGLLIAVPTYSNISEHIEMSVTGVKSFRLVLKDEAANIQIKIKDQFGQVLYKELVENPIAYNRVFNVSPLPAGDYDLELEFPNKHQVIPLKISYSQVELDTLDMVEYFKPTVRQKGSQVTVSMLNVTKDPVNILIFDKRTNNLLSQQKFRDEIIVGTRFDFSKLKAGEYLISMKCNNMAYSQTVTMD